jgi:hypothetical protein
MADRQTQALKRLTKKLNALRKTLRADERNLLDRMILGDEAAAEVVAHRMTTKAADKTAEVVAHRMRPMVDSASRPMISYDSASGNYIVAWEEPEVEAHRLDNALASQLTEKLTRKAT